MIEVVVVGQPYWGRRIAAALDADGAEIRARFVDQRAYAGLLARPPSSDRVMLLRAGYRVGATTPRGRLFDTFWSVLLARLPRAARCHYWLGSDVMDTVAEARAGTLRAQAVAATRHDLHIADAAWLAEELSTVGLEATVAHVPQSYRVPPDVPGLPEAFTALTYFPGARRSFYGGDTVLEAASRMPDIAFGVVGDVRAQDRVTMPNVSWHGWVGEMDAVYRAATVVIRVPRHDGLGATVVEGLLHARHVIYSYALPHVRHLSPVTADGLVAELSLLRDAHAAGRLLPNAEGQDYARREFDPARLSDRLAAVIRGAL